MTFANNSAPPGCQVSYAIAMHLVLRAFHTLWLQRFAWPDQTCSACVRRITSYDRRCGPRLSELR